MFFRSVKFEIWVRIKVMFLVLRKFDYLLCRFMVYFFFDVGQKEWFLWGFIFLLVKREIESL